MARGSDPRGRDKGATEGDDGLRCRAGNFWLGCIEATRREAEDGIAEHAQRMKAYCINLDRRPDRLAHMTAEFARAGIPFERIPAVDGQNPEVAAAAARLPPSSENRRMSGGAYGCLLSHREFWRRLVESGDPWGMVFEDDLLLAPEMGGLLSDDWIPAGADIIKMETLGFRRIHVSAKRHEIGRGRYVARLHSTHFGTGGYIVNSSAARRLLAETAHTGEPVDHVLFNSALPFFQTIVIFQMIPAPVLQGDKARVKDAGKVPSWNATSIIDRHVELQKGIRKPIKPESPLARLWRRTSQEVKTRLRSQRYVVVPHG